jgi:non-heme chloroperoxidase
MNAGKSVRSGDMAFAGRYAHISDDIDRYYKESGEGTPLIFIPGWTMTTKFFFKQLEYFPGSKDFRAIVYDPRGQGRSTKTLENNDYMQRGRDLRALMDVLNIRNVVLAGWSNGCYDAYAYVQSYGPQNLKGFIGIDMSPKGFKDHASDWADCGSLADAAGRYATTLEQRLERTAGFVEWMLHRKPTVEERSWMMDEALIAEGFMLAGPYGSNELQSLSHPSSTLVGWHIEGLQIHRRLSCADAQPQAAAGEGIDHGALLGHPKRVIKREQ